MSGINLMGAVSACLLALLAGRICEAKDEVFGLEQVLNYSYPSNMVASENRARIAWVQNFHGIRNIWVANGPAFAPHQVTHYDSDDGQEITQLKLTSDGKYLLYVRGGDHDANWPGDISPNPSASPQQPQVAIWSVSVDGGVPSKVAEGDEPVLSSLDKLAFIKGHQAWMTDLAGDHKPRPLFFDTGSVKSLQWSPDGQRLAFVSVREKHSYIGVFSSEDNPLLFLAPSTDRDSFPSWSPDSAQIAFVRQPGVGGAPRPILNQTPDPWAIWVADANSGQGHVVWRSPDTLLGSLTKTDGNVNLYWTSDERLIFLSSLDSWPHLYSIAAAGGRAVLLTPGNFMVEHVAESRDRKFLIYDANTGRTDDDSDRRHLFFVRADRAAPVALTSGDGIESLPTVADDAHVAFIGSSIQAPPTVQILSLGDRNRHDLNASPLPADFPAGKLITPTPVTFRTRDGWTIHGQLFARAEGGSSKPAIISVHGGPARQTLLGWHYLDYYSNTYAVNEYLAAHGFIVLAVNYRLGIGYGHAFRHPDHWGPSGASEYQDVLAAARYLQHLSTADPKRIGIWGGSYGGYLTALALARNSDIFKAGVDLHGIDDWSEMLPLIYPDSSRGFEQADRQQAMKIAWQSSPSADIDRWRSPILLIQGDNDHNVPFAQSIDLDVRLTARQVPHEVLAFPNEIHGFLRYKSWALADAATVNFFESALGTSRH